MISLVTFIVYTIVMIIIVSTIIIKNNSKHWKIVNKLEDINLDLIHKLSQTRIDLDHKIKLKDDFFSKLVLLRVKQHRTMDNVRDARISRDEWRKKYETLLKTK